MSHYHRPLEDTEAVLSQHCSANDGVVRAQPLMVDFRDYAISAFRIPQRPGKFNL
jgi:hypothetical protein